MEVHINFGRHAGEVRDIAPEAALAMLADGRASRPGEEPERAEVPDIFQINPDCVSEVASRAFAPEEIASLTAVRPEETVEVQPRRRSRR
jgi:acetyl-CoA acetyltransferase